MHPFYYLITLSHNKIVRYSPGSFGGLILHDHALDDFTELAEVLTHCLCSKPTSDYL